MNRKRRDFLTAVCQSRLDELFSLWSTRPMPGMTTSIAEQIIILNHLKELERDEG